jgi:hypothetical protein
MLALLHKKIQKKKRGNQYWVHTLLCTRLETGQFYALFYELRKEENEMFKRFDEVTNLLEEEICGLATNMR